MKILLLASGGDAPGMNRYIYDIYKKFGDKVYACRAGFKGLVDGDIKPLGSYLPKLYKDCAGSCIKAGRFPEFKEQKYVQKAIKNAKNYDFLVILGGNGSYKGAEELCKKGVRTIFVPSTIDNDVEGSDYSIGFDTAVKECVRAVQNIMPSMAAFTRTCVFEVMGRYCDAIAKTSAKIVGADVLIANKEDLDYKKIAKVMKHNFSEDFPTSIILRENIINLKDFASNLQQFVKNIEVKTFVVGHLQRGGLPTKEELSRADKLASATIKMISQNRGCGALMFENGKVKEKSFS